MTPADGIGLVIALLNAASSISAKLQQAQVEGRELNAADWVAIKAENDAAMKKLQDAVNAAPA